MKEIAPLMVNPHYSEIEFELGEETFGLTWRKRLVAPDVWGFGLESSLNVNGIGIWKVAYGSANSAPIAIYSDGINVYLFPLFTTHVWRIATLLGTANERFVEDVFQSTEYLANCYHRCSGFYDEVGRGLYFVGICQDLSLDSIEIGSPVGLSTFAGRRYFQNISLLSEGSELAKLIETLDYTGGCLMANDLFIANELIERPNEQLVQEIIKSPEKFFMEVYGSPLESRFKYLVYGEVEFFSVIDSQVSRPAVVFGFRINYNLTNRYAAPQLRKERFVVAAYKEALRRRPDLFSCFGVAKAEIIERDEDLFFHDFAAPSEMLVNGSRLATLNAMKIDGDLNMPIPQTREEIVECLTRETRYRTCGIVYNGLHLMFCPGDINILALKHQIPADRNATIYSTELKCRSDRNKAK